MSIKHLRYYNDHTRYLSDSQLRELERRVDRLDAEFQRKNNGQGDYQVILSTESRKMRWGKS
jgi:hypothetical protein